MNGQRIGGMFGIHVKSYHFSSDRVFLPNASKRYIPVKTGAGVIPNCVDVWPGL